ncbi:MAG: anti-sigma factor family protein [Planctomycetota bacterium]
MRKDDKKLLHRALDGEVSRSETRRLRRALQQDGRARAEFEQLRKVVKDTERIKILPPEDFTRRVLEETRKIQPPRPQ